VVLLITSSHYNAVGSNPTNDGLGFIKPSTVKYSRLVENSSTKVEDLPDYGNTSIEIDQHIIEKKKKWRRPDLYGKSLIEQTMEEIDANLEFKATSKRLKEIGLEGMTREEKTKRRRALDSLGVPSFNKFVADKVNGEANIASNNNDVVTIKRKEPELLQLNVGLYCNQACGHCHVESSPLRKEMMTSEVASKCLDLLVNTPSIHTLDITGGAPEMNDNFRYLVSMSRMLRPDLDIIDRCNLTVLQEPGQEDLISFMVQNRLHIIASLPCYSAKNVDTQRGVGVFDRSISALLALNEVGYGKPDSGLSLDLVYNPLGAFLPPPQGDLESKYKEVLAADFGIVFNSLYTMTNMPVKRFADFLYRRDELEDYMDLLVRNFNLSTLNSLMCLNTVSVDYNGKIFDCDFNQQLGYSHGKTVFDIESLSDINDPIKTDNHCFGCTAGMGSS